MAEIVQSLFGVTPESYQMAQQQRADAQALQYAQLDPFQQANFAIGRGANMLAGAAGRALGGQDPELMRITMRQQIARQLNPNDPASIQQGIAALSQAGDTQGAMLLQGEYRKLVESNALVGQREASAAASRAQAGRERTQASPKEVQLAKEVALLSGPEGSPEYNTAYATSLREQMAPKEPKGPGFGTDREAVAAEVYGKTFAELTQPEKAAVNKRVEEEGNRKAAAGAPRLPGEPVKPKDWIDFSTKILSNDPTMVRTNTIISDAPSAIETIRTSTDNDISAASLPSALAQLTGQGKNMSNQDVNRFARTGGLDDRLAQDAVKFFTGGTTKVKKDQAEKFATALYRGALIEQKARLQDQTEVFGYQDSPNYKIALRQIDDRLARFKLAPKPGAENKPAPAQAGKLSDAELLKKYNVRE